MVDIGGERTWSSAATTVPPARGTRTETTQELLEQTHELVEETGYLRSQARIVAADVIDTHHRAVQVDLDVRATSLAKRPMQELLGQLADTGFSWRDIAALAGVSVPALRRWRHGESSTPEHLLDVARLVALVDMLRTDPMIPDVAAWMEVPVYPSVPLTGIDLAADGRYELVMDLATEHRSPEEVLDSWRPGWREAYQSDFEVFEAPDGELGLRPTSTGD